MIDSTKLQELKKEIPYQWRVQQYSTYDATASCVAYIDARDVMDLLDDVCGPENWKDEYQQIDGKLFAGISIKVGDEWVTKYDTGSESNIEKEKGEVSDSFKRAAVKWGVGRFLYNLKIQKVKTNEKLIKTGDKKNYPYVIDDSGNRVWDLTKHINSLKKGTKKAVPTSCKKCGGAVEKKTGAKGDYYSCKQEKGECIVEYNGQWYPTYQ